MIVVSILLWLYFVKIRKFTKLAIVKNISKYNYIYIEKVFERNCSKNDECKQTLGLICINSKCECMNNTYFSQKSFFFKLKMIYFIFFCYISQEKEYK